MFDMGPDTPLSYAGVILRENQNLRGVPYFQTAPEGQFNELLPENVAFNGPPDPIRESEFWAAGEKIKPAAHQRITSHLGLGSWQNWEDGEFHIGKLLGYLKVAMHTGGQRPVDIRGNLQEAVPATFGSMYEVSPLVTQPGPAYTSAGFDLSGQDGYPY